MINLSRQNPKTSRRSGPFFITLISSDFQVFGGFDDNTFVELLDSGLKNDNTQGNHDS